MLCNLCPLKCKTGHNSALLSRQLQKTVQIFQFLLFKHSTHSWDKYPYCTIQVNSKFSIYVTKYSMSFKFNAMFTKICMQIVKFRHKLHVSDSKYIYAKCLFNIQFQTQSYMHLIQKFNQQFMSKPSKIQFIFICKVKFQFCQQR